MTGHAIVAQADARHLPLPDASVDLVLFSPPYFGQRSYTDGGAAYAGQLGSEADPWAYLENLFAVTAEAVRVLKPGGNLFVNIGDKHSTYTGANWGNARSFDGNRGQVPRGGPVNAPEVYGIPYKSKMGLPWRYALGCVGGTGSMLDDAGLVKLLLRDVALGVLDLADAEVLVDQLAASRSSGLGLSLRQEIIWAKLNPMPESASDRARTAHEPIFHFIKAGQRRTYYATDLIREPIQWPGKSRTAAKANDVWGQIHPSKQGNLGATGENPLGKIPGSVWWADPDEVELPAHTVWEMATTPLKLPKSLGVEHYAAFPFELARRIVLGWSPERVCGMCGEGRRPITESVRTFDGQPRRDLPAWAAPDAPRRAPNGAGHWRFGTDRRILGQACACTPYTDHPERRGTSFLDHDRAAVSGQSTDAAERWARYTGAATGPRGPVREYHLDGWTPPPSTPGVVLDLFGGAGTTAAVAVAYDRTGLSFDLSHDYGRATQWRVGDPGERARILGVKKPDPVRPDQGSLFDDIEVNGASA
jgi:DNA modification methylase